MNDTRQEFSSPLPERHNGRHSRPAKLRSLKPEQRQRLIGWLQSGELTYGAIRGRVANEFGVSTSNRAISEFWQKQCPPVPNQGAESEVLLDVSFRSTRPVRVIVKTDMCAQSGLKVSAGEIAPSV